MDDTHEKGTTHEMDAMQVELVNETETVGTETSVPIHAGTFIVVAAINFIVFAQLVAVVGSGFLAQPIAALLGGSGQTVWLSSAITILTVALSPVFAQGADYFGRKVFLVAATTFGFVGALVASRAQTMGTVIAGFTIIGVCFGSQPLLFAVVSEVLPRKYRPIAQATVNFSSGTGVVVGICMGGGLLRSGHLENFRIYCYVVAGIFALATVGTACFYNPPRRELQLSLTFSQKLRKLDWIGYLLFVPGLVLFCVGLSYYKNPYEFSDPRVLGTFVVGIGLALGFFLYEGQFNKHGVLNHDFFTHRNYALALINVFVDGLAFFAANSYYIFEVTVMTGDDILISALHFALISMIANICSVVIGPLSSKGKVIRSPTVVGFGFLLLFFILLATTTPRSPKNVLWGYPVFAGVGIGILLPTIIVAAQLSTPPELISTASGLLIAVRSLGSTVGLAINNALYNAAWTKNLTPKIAAAVLPLGFPSSELATLIPAVVSSNQTALQAIPGATPQIIAAAQSGLVEAYFAGFRNAWIAAACFCAVAVVASCFLVDPHSQFTGHIDAPAEIQVLHEQEEREKTHHHASGPVDKGEA